MEANSADNCDKKGAIDRRRSCRDALLRLILKAEGAVVENGEEGGGDTEKDTLER